MRRSGPMLTGLVACVGMASTVCTKTYTQEDLEAEERRMNAEARAEQEYDERLGEEGGANREGLDEEAEWVERESER